MQLETHGGTDPYIICLRADEGQKGHKKKENCDKQGTELVSQDADTDPLVGVMDGEWAQQSLKTLVS